MDRSLVRPPRPRRLTKRRALIGAPLLALGLAVPLIIANASSNAQAGARTDEPGVTVNLWEWNWPSIGRECTDVLGPEGYDGVQVAPPQDSVKRTELGNGSDTVLHTWWEVYQPVDYGLTSRMGDEAQFRQMVVACRQAGVKVYVDAVINHMTGQGHTSYGGVDFTPYHYPDYVDSDFHFTTGGCPSASGGIEDFNNEGQVFRCNLVGLEDLRTETPRVQQKLARYLNKLLKYGVSGFRVDAAKHIGQADLDAVYSRLDNTIDGVRPYWSLEVGQGSPGTLTDDAFLRSGDVLGLEASDQVKNAFKSYTGVGGIATLEVYGKGSGLVPSEKAVALVGNHDTERNGSNLSYKDGATYLIANVFNLAAGYGSPQVFSSFEYGDDTNASPPSDDDGFITDADCDHGWTCFHRQPAIEAMVKWAHYVGDVGRRHWYDDTNNVIAFSRGNRGWVAINNNATGVAQLYVDSGMPAGRYCDVIGGERHGSTCTGAVVTVGAGGLVSLSVAAKSAVAFDGSDRIGG